MKFLHYTTQFEFDHHIQHFNNLVDEMCMKNHHHKSKMTVYVQANEENIIDFKDIKNMVETILKPLEEKSLNDIMEEDDARTEIFVSWFEKQLRTLLIRRGYGYRIIKINMQETEKYGVELT